MTFPRYPEYKESGVEWLGQVPAHWDVVPLRWHCSVMPSNVDKKSYDGELPIRLCNYTDVYYNERITAGLPFMAATATPDQVSRFSLRAGDVIVTKDSETADDIAVGAFVPEDLPGVVCGYHLALLRLKDNRGGRFLKYLFDATTTKDYVATRANGLTRVGLSQSTLDSMPTVVPPIEERLAIAGFLDRETAKIDALVAEQERLIVLLKEKRQAVISHAVTKGLHPDVPMRESGIEFVGAVPAHWDCCGLTKYLESVVDYRGRTPTKVDEGVLLVTARNVRAGFLDYSESREFIDPSEYDAVMSRGFPAVGDVLFTTEAPLGQVANVDRTDIALAQRIIKFRGDPRRVDNYFLKYWLLGNSAQADMVRHASGSTALGIKGSKIVQLCGFSKLCHGFSLNSVTPEPRSPTIASTPGRSVPRREAREEDAQDAGSTRRPGDAGRRRATA